MKNIGRNIAYSCAFLGLLAIVPSVAAYADRECHTEYGAIRCSKTDDKGNCIGYEREETTKCNDSDYDVHASGPTPHVSPLPAPPDPVQKFCYECTEQNSSGTCIKSRKVEC
jgi:hypothetical protein